MKHKPKISVIMGVFQPQKERFLKSVLSIIRQKFTDWEMILYDDGSSQKERELIEKAAKMDGRILYIRGTVNMGLAHGLNVCIRQAAGVYIARMDDDDVASPDRLGRQSSFLDAHPEYQWVGSNALLEDQRGCFGMMRMPEMPNEKDFLAHSPYIHPSVMFRREVLLQQDGYNVRREVLQCEDYELFFRLHEAGKRGYNLQEPLLKYWEPADAYKKRRGMRRIREMKVRYEGFQRLDILNFFTLIYVGKPLLAGLMPSWLYFFIKRQIRGKKEV